MERGSLISHVLDTCAVLDLASGRWADHAAREELKFAARPVVLSVSVGEIARKLRMGKLTLPCEQAGVLDFVRKICQRHHLHLEALSAEVCHRAELLPPHHEDPFDRMIIALADQAQCPVFTTDRRFNEYPIRVVAQR